MRRDSVHTVEMGAGLQAQCAHALVATIVTVLVLWERLNSLPWSRYALDQAMKLGKLRAVQHIEAGQPVTIDLGQGTVSGLPTDNILQKSALRREIAHVDELLKAPDRRKYPVFGPLPGESTDRLLDYRQELVQMLNACG